MDKHRVHIILDADIYEKLRTQAFLKRATITALVKKALAEYISQLEAQKGN